MRKLLWGLFIVPLLFSCHDTVKVLKKMQVTGEAQGTYYAITYYDSLGRNFQFQFDSILTDFDQTASLWVENSMIRKINRNEQVALNSLFIDLLNKSIQISELTEGYFDVTVGKLVNAWGFGFSKRESLDSIMIDSLKQYIGYSKVSIKDQQLVKIDPNIELDFNAIAQGYASDMLGQFLETKGIENYLVDIGGEVIAKGKKSEDRSWVVGIEKPADNKYSDREIEAKIQLNNQSVVTSGNYRKYYESKGVKYSHTINPFTGYPVEHTLLSASVVASQAWLADAMATAFMVMGLEKSLEFLQQHPDLEAYFIYNENGVYKTYATQGFQKLIVNI